MRSARALARSLAVAGVALLAGAVPGGADVPLVADIVLTQVVEERVAPGRWEPDDPHTALVIGGTTIRVVTVLTNDGPDAADVVARFALPRPPLGEPDVWTRDVMWLPRCAWSATGAHTAVLECRRRLLPGGSTSLRLALKGHSPGEIYVATTLATSAGDPDGALDARTWRTRVFCSINGTPGDDVLEGGEGPDTVCGGAGDDRLVATGPDDRFFGGEGDDVFVAGPHGSEFVGGDGVDTATFARAPAPQMICLLRMHRGIGQGGGTIAIAYGTERYVGSPFADAIWGAPGDDDVRGGRGSDLIAGGAGHDVLDGGHGHDRFATRDGAGDVVRGGPGRDRARADGDDVVASAARVEARWRVANRCRG
jgi:Ca2+-binding RTX toxin-like protein